MHGDSWTFRNIDPITIELVSVATIPNQFIGSGYTYNNGTWTPNAIADQAILPGKRDEKNEELRVPIPQ